MDHNLANHSLWRGAVLTALLCLACALLGAALTGCQDTAAEPTPTGLVYDDAAVEGGWESLGREEIEENPEPAGGGGVHQHQHERLPRLRKWPS